MNPSDMSVEDLKETPWFHNVDPDKLESFEDYAAWPEAIFHNPCNALEEDGELFLIQVRQLVAKVNGLKIEIYSNEHPPPHFHAKSPNVNASFNIESCSPLEGNADGRDKKRIQFWHSHAKLVLINAWNSTRPNKCTVGAYGST